LTRLSDNTKTNLGTSLTPPVEVDGVSYSGVSMAAGDTFKIQPTINGASSFSMALQNTQLIATAAPIVTGSNAANAINATTGATNTGNGIISNTSLDSSAFKQGSSVSFTASLNGTQMQLTAAWTGATPAPDVTVSYPDGTSTTVAAGTAFDYQSGATITSGGVSYTLTGAPAAGDTFNFAPVGGNKGTATISAGSVDKTFLDPATAMTTPTKLTYDNTATPPAFTVSPAIGAGVPVSVTHKDGTTETLPAGASLKYIAGDTYTIGGVTFSISGQPADGDQFTISPNTNASADNRNALAMGALQTKNTIGNTNLQGSYSQLVATIGNKTNEINVTNTAEKARLTAIQTEQQSESGVNQDEELAHMLQNQQQYQAAARIIQAASDMLNVLLTLGN